MTRFLYLAWVHSLLAIVLSVSLAAQAAAGSEQSPVPTVNVSDGIGVKGYDPVAYFTIGRPTPGLDRYLYRWKGVTYRFASSQNREKFRNDPEKYLPQYGGYCAYAMSINRIADIDPSRWAIVNDRLYLNNNFLSYHLWSLNEKGHITSADSYWPLYPKKATGQ
jgi:YHS domain-containing protein